MDENLKTLLELYGESPGRSGEDFAQSDAHTSDDAREIEDFSRIKQALDARPRRRPRPETVDAIVAAAHAASGRGRTDRPPVGRHVRRVLRHGSLAGIVLLLGVSVWLFFPPQGSVPDPRPAASATEDVAGADESTINEAAPPAPETAGSQARAEVDASPEVVLEEEASLAGLRKTESSASTGSRPFAIAAAARESPERSADTFLEEDLSWDQSDDLQELYQQVEELYAISPTGDQWRAVPTRQSFAAPVGLARTQPASFNYDN